MKTKTLLYISINLATAFYTVNVYKASNYRYVCVCSQSKSAYEKVNNNMGAHSRLLVGHHWVDNLIIAVDLEFQFEGAEF